VASEFEIERGEPEPTERGERCRVKVRVPPDLRYLEGHFPNDPIVPGIAQLLPLVHEPAAAAWPDLGPPTAIERLKFKAALRPGHALEVELRREAGKVRFEIRRGETRCTTGVLVFE
jgi:3-hydroxymyristoyl/3-hydroxydecanoyl-(acyl carrier protein) dehydratase